MIADLKPYAEYKESGLPWASRIPAHWSLIPNRAVLKKRKILVGAKHGNYRLLSLTKGGVIVRDISTGKGKFSSDMGTSQEVRKGDFVFCLFDVPETPRTVGLSPHDGMITSAYTVFESKRLSSEGVRFLERFYLAMDDQKLLSPLYSGLRHTIPPPRFLGTKTPQPPPDEQAAIVRFLDHANRKIDGFIRAKRKLIGLLNEQKQAIIHRAVTRGMNPDVSLKPSGIPWLGDIPKHWEVRRLKSFASNVTDQTRTIREDETYIALENVESWTGIVKPQHQEDEILFIGQVKRFAANDVLFGKLRPYLAKVITAKTNGVCVGEFFVLRPKHSVILPRYLEQYLRSRKAIDVINSSTFGSKMPRTDWQFVGNLRVALPPVSEQQLIIESISLETRPLTTAIARTEREIALIQEYRTRLTADLVTGKLDVREAVDKLPASVDDGKVVEPSNELSEEAEEEILES